MSNAETIVALATPPGKSALAVFRLSGNDVFPVVSCCIEQKKRFESAPVRHIALYFLIDSKTKKRIDEVTAIKYQAPNSFSGDNMVEIICHGGPRIIEEITAALIDAGAKPAQRGAFTRRALENGKIDLLKAEAIKGMIESTGNIDIECARRLYEHTQEPIYTWREWLIELSAIVETTIEFGETDDLVESSEKSFEKSKELIQILEKEIKGRNNIKSVENFLPVVIAGPTNAGKSSLFNLLIGTSRAIVHSEPGTTRDIISEPMLICGYHIRLIDSAGIRETVQEVEAQGIVRSREAMHGAGLILWVTAANEPLLQEEIDEIRTLSGEKTICVINKKDLFAIDTEKEAVLKSMNLPVITISVKEKRNIEEVIIKLGTALKAKYEEIEIPDIVLNERIKEFGESLLKELYLVQDNWKQKEIAAHHINNGITLVDELIGKTDNEEILNKIFSNFCVGK